MATIGSFKKFGNEFQGEIVTLSVQAKGIRIVPETNRSSDRELEKRTVAVTAAKTITFEKAAEQYIASHRAGWKSDVHRKQWESTLNT